MASLLRSRQNRTNHPRNATVETADAFVGHIRDSSLLDSSIDIDTNTHAESRSPVNYNTFRTNANNGPAANLSDYDPKQTKKRTSSSAVFGIAMATSEALLPPGSRDVELGEGSPLVGSDRNKIAATSAGTASPPPPLLETVVPDEDEDLAPMPKGASMKEKTVAGAAFFAFVVNLASMILNVINPFALISGFLGVALAPFAAFQQQKITQTEALAETNERMSEEVDQLKGENLRLRQQLRQLQASIKSLKQSKETLKQLQGIQGVTLDELEYQLGESKKIYASMQRNLQGDVLQNLISMVLACDNDGDMILSDGEIDELIFNLEGVHGVELKEESIRQTIINHGRSLNAIMDVAKEAVTAGENNGGASGLFKFLKPEDS